jgi:hypothetical protein
MNRHERRTVEAKASSVNVKKPTLTLSKLPSKPPSKPVALQSDERYSHIIYNFAMQELERAEYDKAAAFTATMERIIADDALFRHLAMILIRQKCRKRIKKLCRRRADALEEQGETWSIPKA